jgi:hypothetical protein
MKVCDICEQEFKCTSSNIINQTFCPECRAKEVPKDVTDHTRYLECPCGERIWIMDGRGEFKIKCPQYKTGYSK